MSEYQLELKQIVGLPTMPDLSAIHQNADAGRKYPHRWQLRALLLHGFVLLRKLSHII